MDSNEKNYRFGLSKCPGIGFAFLKNSLKQFGDISTLWNMSTEEILKIDRSAVMQKFVKFRYVFDIKKSVNLIEEQGLQFLVFGEKDYPLNLSNISSPPICVFWKGNLSILNYSKCISIVGTRRITDYGKQVIRSLCEGFVEKGFTIVSGMAYGVDSYAHKCTLENGGNTIAVLPSNPVLSTPPGNDRLHKEILTHGLVISENDSTKIIHPKDFPKRNRIIAGLSLGTIVIEAAEKSGALITAHMAFDENRLVFAVPGNIGQSMSKGSNHIIKIGKAKLIENVEDVLYELGYMINDHKQAYQPKDLLEKDILDMLFTGTFGVDKLVYNLSSDIVRVTAKLSEMELEGIINKNSDGTYNAIV